MNNKRINKLCVGTAQFGMKYGVSNNGGQPDFKEVTRILSEAYEKGVRYLDTAPSYGNSEDILGISMKKEHSFNIITKTPHFNKEIISNQETEKLRKTFYSSLKKLKRQSVYGLLLHNANDLFVSDGHLLLKTMKGLKAKGHTEKVGVSVYTGKQIDDILNRFDIDFIQVPINVLDQRLLSGGYLKKIKEKNIEVHARSVYLQGIILNKVEALPSYFDSIKDHLRSYHEFLRKVGLTPAQAALGFLKKQREVDVVLVGVDNRQQMNENIEIMNHVSLEYDLKKYAIDKIDMIDPSKWNF